MGKGHMVSLGRSSFYAPVSVLLPLCFERDLLLNYSQRSTSIMRCAPQVGLAAQVAV